MNMRAVWAKIAKGDWHKDTGGDEVGTRELPPLMDGSNCRAALLMAQCSQPSLYDIIMQIRSELGGKELRKSVGALSPTMKPAEREQYRLSPEDEVLEGRVILAACRIWVPVVPDCSVIGKDPPVSWWCWIYEFAHA